MMRKLILKIISAPGLDKYVIFSIAFTIVYTIAEFIVSTITGVHHEILTEWVYKFFAGEVVVCALIKIFKLVPTHHIVERLQETIGFSLEEDNECDDGK